MLRKFNIAPRLILLIAVQAVILGVVGGVAVYGLNVAASSTEVLNRNVSEVSLSVTEFKSRSIYVLGRVVSPGKYAYADAINLFAGGDVDKAVKALAVDPRLKVRAHQ